MKYFTPELFIRSQDLEDEEKFLETTEAWEQAVQAYGEQLKNSMSCFPSGLRRFAEAGSLHDSVVRGIWHGRTHLTIVLQRDIRANKLFLLNYALVDAPYINPVALPDSHRSEHSTWLYDEIALDQETIFDVAACVQRGFDTVPKDNAIPCNGAPIFTHSILLSNGWEIRLRFHELNVSRQNALLPTLAGASSTPQAILPRSA